MNAISPVLSVQSNVGAQSIVTTTVSQNVLVQLMDDLEIECRGGLYIDLVFKYFFHDEAEVRAFRAIAVEVIAFVFVFADTLF